MGKGLTGFALKMIAIVTMAVDHVGAGILAGLLWQRNIVPDIFAPFSLPADTPCMGLATAYMVCRLIGRIAFPIFVFLMVEGFFYTRDVKKYMSRLFLFALLSEIPFDLMVFGTAFDLRHQNVFFTLVLAVGMLWLFEKWRGYPYRQAAVVAGTAVLAEVLRTDYGAFGILLAFLLYVLRDYKRARNVVGAVICLREYTAPLSFLFISMYNGKRGANLKWFFYLFYPAHLLVIFIIARMLL